MLSLKKEGLGWRNLSLYLILGQMVITNLKSFITHSLLKIEISYVPLDMIEKAGIHPAIQLEWVKKLDSEIYEIRSKISSNIQRALYFHIRNNQYIITHGFTKKTQKKPTKEIIKAKQIKQEFEEEYYATKNFR